MTMNPQVKVTSISVPLEHGIDEFVNQDTDEAWNKVFGRAPDAVKHYPDGSEKWYYLTYVGGVDDEGVYDMVTDGPAAGERCYV